MCMCALTEKNETVALHSVTLSCKTWFTCYKQFCLCPYFMVCFSRLPFKICELIIVLKVLFRMLQVALPSSKNMFGSQPLSMYLTYDNSSAHFHQHRLPSVSGSACVFWCFSFNYHLTLASSGLAVSPLWLSIMLASLCASAQFLVLFSLLPV